MRPRNRLAPLFVLLLAAGAAFSVVHFLVSHLLGDLESEWATTATLLLARPFSAWPSAGAGLAPWFLPGLLFIAGLQAGWAMGGYHLGRIGKGIVLSSARIGPAIVGAVLAIIGHGLLYDGIVDRAVCIAFILVLVGACGRFLTTPSSGGPMRMEPSAFPFPSELRGTSNASQALNHTRYVAADLLAILRERWPSGHTNGTSVAVEGAFGLGKSSAIALAKALSAAPASSATPAPATKKAGATPAKAEETKLEAGGAAPTDTPTDSSAATVATEASAGEVHPPDPKKSGSKAAYDRPSNGTVEPALRLVWQEIPSWMIAGASTDPRAALAQAAYRALCSALLEVYWIPEVSKRSRSIAKALGVEPVAAAWQALLGADDLTGEHGELWRILADLEGARIVIVFEDLNRLTVDSGWDMSLSSAAMATIDALAALPNVAVIYEWSSSKCERPMMAADFARSTRQRLVVPPPPQWQMLAWLLASIETRAPGQVQPPSDQLSSNVAAASDAATSREIVYARLLPAPFAVLALLESHLESPRDVVRCFESVSREANGDGLWLRLAAHLLEMRNPALASKLNEKGIGDEIAQSLLSSGAKLARFILDTPGAITDGSDADVKKSPKRIDPGGRGEWPKSSMAQVMARATTLGGPWSRIRAKVDETALTHGANRSSPDWTALAREVQFLLEIHGAVEAAIPEWSRDYFSRRAAIGHFWLLAGLVDWVYQRHRAAAEAANAHPGSRLVWRASIVRHAPYVGPDGRFGLVGPEAGRPWSGGATSSRELIYWLEAREIDVARECGVLLAEEVDLRQSSSTRRQDPARSAQESAHIGDLPGLDEEIAEALVAGNSIVFSSAFLATLAKHSRNKPANLNMLRKHMGTYAESLPVLAELADRGRPLPANLDSVFCAIVVGLAAKKWAVSDLRKAFDPDGAQQVFSNASRKLFDDLLSELFKLTEGDPDEAPARASALSKALVSWLQKVLPEGYAWRRFANADSDDTYFDPPI